MKMKKVLETTSRHLGTATYWILLLECGHQVRRKKSGRFWAGRANPAPQKVKCEHCAKISEGSP